MLVIFALVFMIAIMLLYERSLGARPYRGPVSDHFDGQRFFSPEVRAWNAKQTTRQKSVWAWLLMRSRGEWARREVVPVKPKERVHDGIQVTYINHSTVLLQCSGLNIITDPIYARRASPFRFLGPTRYADPGVLFEDLPPIDIVLLSHNHYDHMDLAALRAIATTFKPAIFTGLGNTAYLTRKGITGARDMDWWDRIEHAGITIVSTPAKHFSSRAISDRNRTLWCGFVLETSFGNIYFSGDTGFGSFVSAIAERYASFVLALLPIGAYDPEWMMQAVHTNPDEAIRMHDLLHVEQSVGIHFGTFRLTDEPQSEPAARIARDRGERIFHALDNGGTVLMKADFS